MAVGIFRLAVIGLDVLISLLLRKFNLSYLSKIMTGQFDKADRLTTKQQLGCGLVGNSLLGTRLGG